MERHAIYPDKIIKAPATATAQAQAPAQATATATAKAKAKAKAKAQAKAQAQKVIIEKNFFRFIAITEVKRNKVKNVIIIMSCIFESFIFKASLTIANKKMPASILKKPDMLPAIIETK